ncbi:hypothetical protein ACIRN4_06340 [Pimelobacter simplex]
MKSPEGEEKDIAPAGVRALSLLGWEVLESDEPPKRRGRRPAAQNEDD